MDDCSYGSYIRCIFKALGAFWDAGCCQWLHVQGREHV